MKKLFDRIPEWSRRPILILILFHTLGYAIPKYAAMGMYHHNFETAMDRSIPFFSWMVIVYVGAYSFWVINVLLTAREDRVRAVRFFTADVMTKIICMVFFIVLPTTNVRPQLGAGFCDGLLGLIYAVDTPDNLFPSIHCAFSWLCFRGIAGSKKLPLWYQVFSMIFTFMIFLSTVMVRQHVLADVAGGWLFAEVCWQAAGIPALQYCYERLLKQEAAL